MLELDKLQKEKTNLESQLVVYKLKYAENSSKIMELEDEKDMLKKRSDNFNEKVKAKDEIIKNLIQERDNVKSFYRGKRDRDNSNKNIHDYPSILFTERCQTDVLRDSMSMSTPHSPERKGTYSHKKNSKNIYLATEAISNDHDIYQIPTVSGSKTPSGFAKLIKNIFNSDKR